jgi:hypothetical protein
MFIYAESPLENAEDVSAAAGVAVALVLTEHVLFATTGPAAAADATTVTVMFPAKLTAGVFKVGAEVPSAA